MPGTAASHNGAAVLVSAVYPGQVASLIAHVAPAISAGGLAVQMNREWRTWATRVRVTVEQTFVHPAGGQPERVVLFTILNRSDHAVNITRLGMEPITRGGESIFVPSPLPAGPGPWPVPPHGSIGLYQAVGSLSDGELDRTTRARVMTSHGKTVWSKRVRVRELTKG